MLSGSVAFWRWFCYFGQVVCFLFLLFSIVFVGLVSGEGGCFCGIQFRVGRGGGLYSFVIVSRGFYRGFLGDRVVFFYCRRCFRIFQNLEGVSYLFFVQIVLRGIGIVLILVARKLRDEYWLFIKVSRRRLGLQVFGFCFQLLYRVFLVVSVCSGYGICIIAEVGLGFGVFRIWVLKNVCRE